MDAPAASGLTITGDALTLEGLIITPKELAFPRLVRGTITGLETTTGPGLTMAGFVVPAALGLAGACMDDGEAWGDDQTIFTL